MTVRTSAKSTLIRPGRTIRSAIPCTAPCSTSLAARNACTMVALRPSTVISFSLGMVISESQWVDSSSMPFSATCMRRRPSNGNGLVTTATVRMPISLASCATTGAAPVPVPPPMPAVMNTMSAPSSAAMICSRSSSAAWRPTSGWRRRPAPGDVAAELQLHLRAAVLDRLRVGVGGDEFHAIDAAVDHVCHGVSTAAADADDLDHRVRSHLLDQFEMCHVRCPLYISAGFLCSGVSCRLPVPQQAGPARWCCRYCHPVAGGAGSCNNYFQPLHTRTNPRLRTRRRTT